MPYALNNVTTKNEYDSSTTLNCTESIRFNLHVFNAAIYWRMGTTPGVRPGAQSGQEIFRAPGYYSYDRKCDTIEVRSAVAGVPAQVTIDAWRSHELI